MLEDFTVAAAHDALQPSSNLTLAQIVVWQTRNPFPPKTRTINCSDWSSHSFAVSRGLINAVTGKCPALPMFGCLVFSLSDLGHLP